MKTWWVWEAKRHNPLAAQINKSKIETCKRSPSPFGSSLPYKFLDFITCGFGLRLGVLGYVFVSLGRQRVNNMEAVLAVNQPASSLGRKKLSMIYN